MRIITGKLGGRQLQSPKGHRTHPMSEKARGAIFNMLGDITGLTVLDAFAGSGALSLEAVSRGAAHATAIEIDPAAYQTIIENIQTLRSDHEVTPIRARAGGWSDNNPDAKFDIIICDPPYDQTQLPTIQKLIDHLGTNGTLVLSWPGNQPLPTLEGLQTITSKDYGDAQIAFYQVS